MRTTYSTRWFPDGRERFGSRSPSMTSISKRISRVRVVEGDEEAADVEHAAHFRINPLEQRVEIERGAERAADFIQDVQLFAAARGLLDQVAVLDRHADLLAEREKQPQLRRSEAAVVRRAEQQDAEDALLGLQADADHRAQALREQQVAHLAEGFLSFERLPVRVARQVAQNDQPAQPRHQIHDV